MKTAHKGMKRMGLLLVMLMIMFGMVSGAEASSINDSNVILPGDSRPTLSVGGTNDRDGSKIEGVKVVWVTQDSATTAEGDPTPQAELDNKKHLYLSSVSNGEMNMVYKIEAEFSGQYDYAPGDITITIPAQVWHGRKYEATGAEGETVGVVDENKLLGYLELPIPAAPSKQADFNWQIINGNYVLTNTRTIGATSSVSIEVGIRGVRPVDVVDMSETDPITAHVEVVTNQGNTIELTSTPIYAQLDTQAKITGAYKNGEVFEDYPGLDEKLLANLPADAKPEDYIYVRWYTHHSHNNNQPYSLDIADVLSDAYKKVPDGNGKTIEQKVTDGIFLGSTNYEGQVLTDSETDFTAEIGDHFSDTTTGTQYANTVYMWSAYRKDAFEVPNANEPQRVYYFKNKVTWTLTETDKAVADAGLDKGEDKQKVTQAWDEVVVPYAPVKWQRPTGAFAVNKWTEAVGHKDWLYGYALNLLENRDEVDMDFIVETVGYGYPWTSELTKGFSYGELNNTVVNGDLESLELDASMFGKLGWKQVTDDFQTFFNFEKEPLTSEDFEFKSLRVSVPRKMRYAKQSNGTWDYVTDSKLPTPDLVIEYQLNNEDTWYPAATATWGEDGLGQFAFKDVNTAGGVTTSGMTVFFPENVTDTRHTFVSNVFGGKTAETCDIAMLDWYVYPTITMKSSDRVYGIVQELFEQSENPSTKFKNDVIMDAYGWVEAEGEGTLVLNDDFDSSLATYEGASYGVSLTKSGSSRSDVENQRLIVHYTATVTEQSNLKERSDYDAAVAAGVIPAETSGVWYDLLPPHVVPLLDTVKLRGGDTITNVYTVEDYKDTGRTLLVVEADLTPAPSYANSLGYADRPRLEFDAAYTWMDMDEYGRELVNYVAFESTVDGLRNDTLGTIKNQKGEPDTPAGGNNATTPSMSEEIIEALTDLDPNTDENRFVYGKTSNTVAALTYAVSGLEKAVKNDLVGIWTQGLDNQEQVTVYEGHHYTYRLRVSSAETTCTKGIVIYDTIENYIIPDPTADKDTDATKAADFAHTQERKDWSGDWQGKGQWRGTLESVDLSEFVNAKVKPVLLYSTIPNLQFADTSSESTDDNFDEDTELLSSGNYDITNREIWQVAELDENGIWQVPEGLNVTAVAIDATTTVDGEEFVLRPEEALAGYLKMRAPDDEGDEGTWNAKGAYARKAEKPEEIDWEAAMDKENNMYAYNNARVRLIQGVATNDGGANWLSSYRMIRNDYTRVGIVPEIVTVEKKWQDQKNHDAMRPESVTISVLRRLAGTAGKAQPVLDKDGQPITAVLDKSNGWKAEFHQMDIVNEDGLRYLYSFEEVPVEGYTSKVQFVDVNHYTMTNVHPNEQIDVSGVKTWEDNENALGLRPDRVTVKLYRDGVQIDTRTVKANGAGEWKYSFGKLDKYAEGGKEYTYTVEEEYVPKYVGEADGYEQVKNTYIPVGELEVSKTLVNATEEARKKEFAFTLVLLAEKTDPAPDAPAVPLMEKYPYTIYTLEGEEWVPGATGEIGNSGVFKLKENQKIVVEGLPSEATYQVIESEAAGFTSTATDATGTIRAGQTAQAAFVNEYKASGSVQLNVGKSLTGHAIRKNQFRFELVDMNKGSATYGEVIRTARVEAPKDGATTGGSGEAIESLSQAIFGQLEYTQDDHGNTYNYQVREVKTGKPGYTTDAQVYGVAVKVEDNGDGSMTVTPDWGKDDSMLFKNTYTATGELTLKAWKTLEGRELKEGEFTFELWSFDPQTKETIGTEPLDTVTNNEDGDIVFDALEFNQDHVSLDEKSPAKYTYLIREKQGKDKTVAYSNQEYVITVSVFDNGDGTLSFAQGSQGYEREYLPCSACGGLGLKRIEFTNHYNSSTGTGGNGFTPYRDSKTQAILQIICKECNGLTKHADPSLNLANGYCAACGGSGIQANQTIVAGGKEYVFGNYRKSPVSSQMIVPVEGYDFLGVAVCNHGGPQVSICESCVGARIVPGAMKITGPAAIPVFANELKPGNLAVTKKVQGEGSTDPDQLFDFTIKLTGEVPAKLNYGMVAPTPAPTATPEPTAAPTAKPVATIRPTTEPTVMPITKPTTVTPTTKPTEPFKATNLDGEGLAVLNKTTGEMVFFRDTPDYDGATGTYTYTYKGAASDDKEIIFSTKGKYSSKWNKTVTADDGTEYEFYGNFENITSTSGVQEWPWAALGGLPREVRTISMEGDIKLSTSAHNMFHTNFSFPAELTEVNLSRLDTSNVTNMYGMFSYCDKLTSIKGLTLNTSNVTNMSDMFYNCSALTSLDLSTFNTGSVTNMSDMFNNCSALTSLGLNTFDTSSVTNMSYMFKNCSGLTNLKLDTFDTSSVTNMSFMFNGCSGLTNLNLDTFDTSSVTDMSFMFSGCSGLTNLNLDTFDTSNVTTMSNMFKNCSGLTNLNLDTFDTSNVTTMSNMFKNCSGLTSLKLGMFDTSNVTNMNSMFSGCSGLTNLNLDTFDTSSVTNMHAMFNDCSALTSLDLSTFDTSKVTKMSSMFRECDSLTALNLSTFNTGSVTTMEYMFYDCGLLTSLDLSTFNTSSVTNMKSMFRSCNSLTELDLSTFDTSKVTDMGSMFSWCRSLTSLDLSTFNTSKVMFMSFMFSNCNKLTELDLSTFDTSKVTEMSSMFGSGDNLSTVAIGNATKLGYNNASGSYPTAPASGIYTGKWVKVANDTDIMESKPLFTEGGHAGTWTWEKANYTLNFAPGEGGAGAMPSVKVLCGEAYTFVPLFYNFGYDLIGFSDDGTTTVKYPVSGGLVTIPSTNGYQNEQTVTLTAIWQERDVDVSETGDTISFALKAGETINLNNLPATTAYEVWENTPAGWVLVKKVDDTGVIKPLETSNAVFTNEYTPEKVSVALRASKLLDGKAPAGAFSFTLSENGQVIQTKQNVGSGVSFDLITYDKDAVGTHTYTITEVTGDDETINYDPTEYTVTVVVTDDNAGTLSAKVTYAKGNKSVTADELVFRNTTKPGGLSIAKQITGELTDKARAQEFTFEVTFTDELMQPWSGTLKMGEGTLDVKDGKATVTLKGGESVTLTEIPAGLKYQVEEIGSYPGWVLMKVERPSGTIAAAQTAESKFTNAYVLSGQASIEVKKELLGRDLTKDEFTFKILDQDGKAVENKDCVAITATNGTDGSVLFPQITYTKEGTWEYRIVEEKPSEDKIDNTVEYSTEEIVATVTAEDKKGDGNLTVTVEYSPEDKTITNKLKPGALKISKTVNSTNPAHGEKAFVFTVKLTDKEGKALNGTYIMDGVVSLPVQDGEARIYLRDGESATISGLPASTRYSVTETEAAGFTTVSEGESGVIESTKTAEASFTNTYAAQGVYDFNVTKTLAGREMAEGEFEFVLLDEAGNELETVRNTADGKVAFEQLAFTDQDVGTKTYNIKETDLKSPGVTYDKTVREITLTITDNGDGTLSVTDSLNGEAAEFENSYNDKTSVSVKKVWQDEDDKLSVRPDSVTVELYRNGEKQAEIELNAENEWQHIFADLAAFDEEGVTYTYTVKEVPVAGYDSMQSLTDGARVITNTVQGVLDVSKTVVGGTDETKEFTFTVTLTKADEPVTKELVLTKGENSEPVAPDADGKVSFTLKHGETVRLIGLPIGTAYKVEETEEAGYATTAEKAEGLIQRYEEHKASFTNTYEAKGEMVFSGKKGLEGRELAEGEFSFTLYDANGDEIETVKNAADGSFAFTKLEYIHNAEKSDLGEHTYTVKEVQGDLGGVTYDTSEYPITVTVTDNGDGTLDVAASDNAKALNYVNTYEARGETTFSGKKTLEGRELAAGEFSFALLDKDGKTIETVKNAADGSFAFAKLEYIRNAEKSDLGEHTYTVKEVEGDLGGMTYDEKEYTITVTVTDNGDGTLKVVASDNAEALNFVNTYEAKGETTFSGKKTLEGRELAEGEFSFMLLDEDGNAIETVKNAANGSFAFTTLEYIRNANQNDLGEHSYTVKEVQGDLGGVTYDTTEYPITVTITDNGDGTLDVGASDNAKALNFVNTYEAKGETTFSGKKTLEGRDLAEGEFSFTLLDEDGNAIETVKNGVDGTIEFSKLTYTEADLGDYTYTVKEVAGELGGVTYDETEYTIAVTVTDNGDGTLKVVASDNAEALNFVNTYEAKGETTFSGKKTLEGRELKAGEFSFTLYDANGDEIKTVKNATDGSFAFTKLEYIRNAEKSDLGEHSYTVKEVKNALKGVTYDTTEYTVKVTVTDNGDGTLKVVASENAAVLDFTNYYDADGELTLRAVKTVNGAEPRADEVFTFELCDAAGKVLQTVKNAQGKITFEALKYTEADVGKSYLYTVKEKQEKKPGYTTDDTVYTVAVWVADGGDGSLKVTKAISSEGKAVEAMSFENTYEAKGEWKPAAAKTVNGAEPREDQVYEFTLTDKDGNTILAENEKGEITFDTLTYDLADAGKTYTYTVQEITTPTDLLATDDSIYTVDVTVTDNKDGTLDAKTVITKGEKEVEEITFENKLTTLLSISKTVEGIETTETFPMTVKLYNANGTEAEGEYAYTGDAEGKLKCGDAIKLAHGQSVTISGLLPGMTYTVTEAAAAAYETTVNGNAGNSIEGTLAETENNVAFVNKFKTTMFMVKKSWQGGGGGAIELTLYANGEKIEPQPIYTRDENVYVYTDLPMYDEQDQIIVYSAKEKYVDGFLTIYKNVAPYADETKAIYDGGTIINKAIVKADFSVKKEWSGLAEGEEAPAIELVLYCNGVATDIKTPNPDRNGWYKYYDLPGEVDDKPAVYTVKELPVEGYETSYELANGTSAEYADNGGTITNAKVPQTGDGTPLALWLTLMGASAMMLVLLLKRRKA